MGNDRRIGIRFPLKFSAQLSWADRNGKRHAIRARTVDVSSGGFFVPMKNVLPVKQKVRISVKWPVKDAGKPLELICEGAVARIERRGRARGVAVTIKKYSLTPRTSPRRRRKK